MTTANSSPNLLSRDAYYTLGVVRPCYAVEAEQSNLQADLQANLQGLHMADLQANLHGSSMIDLQGDLQHNQPEIHSIEASNNTQLPDEEHKTEIIQVFDNTEYWDSEQQKGFNWSQHWIQIQIYTWICRMCEIYNQIYKICKIYMVSRIYNMICNQIYTDSDSQSEETASSG